MQNVTNPVNAIPKPNLPESSSPIHPMEFVDSQIDDLLGDISNPNCGKLRFSIATQSNGPTDKDFRFNFVDLLTGLVSFDSLHSLMEHIPTGERIAAALL